MTIETSPIHRLQAQCLDEQVPVSQLLRLAKTIAVKLDLCDAFTWIDGELNGYMDEDGIDTLPSYRLLSGEWQGLSAYGGWQSIHFETAELAKKCSVAPIGLAVGALENDCHKQQQNGVLAFAGMNSVRTDLVREFGLRDARLVIQPSQLWAIVDRVRTIVLNWSLELEKAGVVGEGLTFSGQEKEEAATVTHQYFIQNVGVIGDVNHGHVVNKQNATVAVNSSDICTFVTEARKHLGALPTSAAQKLEPILNDLESESDGTRNGRVRELLLSVRSILEGAASGAIVEGLKVLVGKCL